MMKILWYHITCRYEITLYCQLADFDEMRDPSEIERSLFTSLLFRWEAAWEKRPKSIFL